MVEVKQKTDTTILGTLILKLLHLQALIHFDQKAGIFDIYW